MSFTETNLALPTRLDLSGYGMGVRFGIVDGAGELWRKMDSTLGSGNDGIGAEEILRFDRLTRQLVGGYYAVPLSHIRFGDLPEYLGHKVATAAYGDLSITGDRLSIPKCSYATLDTRLKLVLCSAQDDDIPSGKCQLYSATEGVLFIVEDGAYMGFLLHDPLSRIPGSDLTQAVDYDVLQAMLWPHRDRVFAQAFDDEDQALKDYYCGLQAALGHYLSGRRPIQRLFRSAIQDAIAL